MKRVIYYLSIILFLSLAGFISCDEEKLITPDDKIVTDEDIANAMDDAFADDIFEELDAGVEIEIGLLEASGYTAWVQESTENNFKSTNDAGYLCKKIFIDVPGADVFPKKITIDYGDSCSAVFGSDTITKSGKVIIQLTQPRFEVGSKRIVTFENHSINGIMVDGKRTITYNGLDETEVIDFDINLENGKLSFPDTTTYTRESQRKRKWLRQSNHFNDIIYVTGNINGINRSDTAYSREIIERLTIVRCSGVNNYKWTIVDGLVECTVGSAFWSIDYGYGTCDNTATITREDQEKPINIRRRYRSY